ncbi:MAG: hypothetical protein A2X25_10485 [Chloroflexi bacterium GWB2_49_20]|nr:MAG: hypothetical protein A2X25_10485 [Chloroflexi bacterium GWB2_49_20]OGN79009.1 MAG: hypothetical protein A2X26_00870 [Chloroflexi bacterium GWC2_49_37]OGN86230.1 MAG: hypothetical protein A2X27_04910 [Chloroflexi bacterium GWD2_49_16]
MTGQVAKNEKEINGNGNKQIRLSMVVIKGLILFLIFNLIFAACGSRGVGKISLYNYVFPGRFRLPFGENPAEAYNFSLNNLDAMFASHLISGIEKTANEYRVILIGDSSTWGILLRPEDTLSGLLNIRELSCNGRLIRAYNLGYPTLSLTKDVLVLEQAMQFEPDLIIWPVTLESFPLEKQLTSPLVAKNLNIIQHISDKYGLHLGGISPGKPASNVYDKSIVGQRRNIADLLRLQLFGVMWSATGIDQIYPTDYERAQVNLENSTSFHDWLPPVLGKDKLAFDILDAGEKIAGDVPILLINEPILISNGENSDIRYNFYYPRWAYDQYRRMLAEYSIDHSLRYLDLWDIVPMVEFTNSSIHLTPLGETMLAEKIIEEIRNEICPR